MKIEKLGRKGVICLVAILSLTLLAAIGREIGFRDVFTAVVLGFFAGNYGEHREKRKETREDPPAQ